MGACIYRASEKTPGIAFPGFQNILQSGNVDRRRGQSRLAGAAREDPALVKAYPGLAE